MTQLTYDYHVAIQVGPQSIPGLHVVAAPDGNEAVIGRDVLSHLVVTLDGPAGILTVLSGAR